jgi:hypothetical protein
VVETQYAGRADPSAELVLERRFSDGEIQYLLQDWPTASVLFYDLLADKTFDHNPRRPDALWYLSDCALPAAELRQRPALPPASS